MSELPCSVSPVEWTEIALRAGIVVVAGLLAMAGNPAIRGLLRWIDRQPARAPASPDDDVATVRSNLGLAQAQRELPGGRWVGVLERLAVYACIVAGFPAGIAMVLAVKGLGRYAELVTESSTSRKGELFIIGTFASLLWASLWAGAAYWGLRAW